MKVDDEEYKARYWRFMSIAAKPAELARQLNKMCRGVNWTHGAKKDMAEAYATQSRSGAPASLPPTITDDMVAQLLEEYGIK